MLKTFLIACAVMALSQPAFAEENCDPYPDVPVHVTPVFDEPKYDFDTDISGIRTLLNDAQHNIQESHDTLPLGVTHYEPMMEFRLPVQTMTSSDGLSCARVQRADVTIGYRNVTVYIAREVFQNTCGFEEIMAHEQKHIAVNRQILQEYMPIIEGKLKDYLRLNGVFREQNPDYAISLLREKLQEILDGLAQQMADDNRARQHEVDSPAEYGRLTASCNGQLAHIASNFLGANR